jgi:hypothetical protein
MLIILFFEQINNKTHLKTNVYCRQHTMDGEDDFDVSSAKVLTLEDVMEEIKGLKLIVSEMANKQNTVEKVYVFYIQVW